MPQFSEAFKIQFAPGFTCSPTLSWQDVGDPASTTALWRGYENSIVGSDWLDADWGRRIKLTVNNSVVEDDVTDFPVYLNLANLPAGFLQTFKVTEMIFVSLVMMELVRCHLNWWQLTQG